MLLHLHEMESTVSSKLEVVDSSSEQDIQEILLKVQKEVERKGLHFWDNTNEDNSPTMKKFKK